MNSAGIVVLALLGGALVVLLILGMIMLAWGLWIVWKEIKADQKLRETQAAEMKATAESTKSSYASIKAEMTRQQEAFLKETRQLVEGSSAKMEESVGRINAQALEAASMRGLQACIRMEKVAVALQKMLMTVDTPEENRLAPEEYAPNDNTIYSRQSDVARGDAEAETEDQQVPFSF